jgi:hypothetical protein
MNVTIEFDGNTYTGILTKQGTEVPRKKYLLCEVLTRYGELLHITSDGNKDDKEIVMNLFGQNNKITYLNNEMKNDKEVIMEAVKYDGYVLKLASENLQNDKEVVLAAVKQEG